MSIFRIQKTKDYSVISNTALKDKRLSWKAKGLFAYLMSCPDDWNIYLKQLMDVSSDGQSSTTTALNELIEYQYITRERIKNQDGTFSGYDYKVYEIPYLENQNTDNQKLENQNLLNTNSTNVLNKLSTNSTYTVPNQKTLAPPKSLSPHQRFVEGFMSVYERKTSSGYKAKNVDFINSARMIKEFGIDAVVAKAEILACLCEQARGSVKPDHWFCKNGWSDFSIAKLSSCWNYILPELLLDKKALQKQRENEELFIKLGVA